MKRFLICLFVVISGCSEIPENKKSCWAPKGNGTCLEQLFNDLSDDKEFFELYEVDWRHNAAGKDLDGTLYLKIHKSFYDLAKSRGRNNYPDFDEGWEAIYRSALVETRYSSTVSEDLSEYIFISK